MTALTRQTLVGAAATAVAAALPPAAEAEPGFIEIIVYDSIEDDIADARGLYYGGPRPPFRIERVNAANTCANSRAHVGRLRDRFVMTIFSRRQTLLGITATAAVFALPAVATAAPAKDRACTGIIWDAGIRAVRAQFGGKIVCIGCCGNALAISGRASGPSLIRFTR
jgi:hypothetical protein